MRLKLIACKALYREISLITATSANFIDVTYLRQGLHNTPGLLKEALQMEINRIDEGDDLHTYKNEYSIRDFDAILLGYGLCSNGVAGLSSAKYPIIVPKAHDCITLFLGSQEKYLKYFNAHPGTYWYNASWIENALTPSEQTDREMYDFYAEKYGEENAGFLVQSQLTANYSRCVFIKWEELPFPEYEKYTRDAAKHEDWEFDLVDGNSSYLRDFLNGKWDEKRFLTVPPRKRIAPDYSGDIITLEDEEIG
jgi:hypothetical protein